MREDLVAQGGQREVLLRCGAMCQDPWLADDRVAGLEVGPVGVHDDRRLYLVAPYCEQRVEIIGRRRNFLAYVLRRLRALQVTKRKGWSVGPWLADCAGGVIAVALFSGDEVTIRLLRFDHKRLTLNR